MNKTIEGRRTISQYPNCQVSNLGRDINIQYSRIIKCSKDSYGYCIVELRNEMGGKTFKVHWFVAQEFIENDFDKAFVDHIDLDVGNNRVSNLRWATNEQNQMNRQSQVGSSSIYKGAVWDKDRNQWRTAIRSNKKILPLGLFNNGKDAAIAYNEKAIELFCEYAYVCEISDEEQDED